MKLSIYSPEREGICFFCQLAETAGPLCQIKLIMIMLMIMIMIMIMRV